jgi:hypothetical protein
MDEKSLFDAYGPYTHAARSLCLWRGVEPYQFFKTHHLANESRMTNDQVSMTNER